MIFYALDDQHIVGLFEQGLEHVEERDGGHRAKSTPASAVSVGGEGPPRRSAEDGSGAKTGLPRRSAEDGSGAKAGLPRRSSESHS
jgi:hypothetical protein